jgi:hypothetical protein
MASSCPDGTCAAHAILSTWRTAAPTWAAGRSNDEVVATHCGGSSIAPSPTSTDFHKNLKTIEIFPSDRANAVMPDGRRAKSAAAASLPMADVFPHNISGC